jgi:hypothetical protein
LTPRTQGLARPLPHPSTPDRLRSHCRRVAPLQACPLSILTFRRRAKRLDVLIHRILLVRRTVDHLRAFGQTGCGEVLQSFEPPGGQGHELGEGREVPVRVGDFARAEGGRRQRRKEWSSKGVLPGSGARGSNVSLDASAPREGPEPGRNHRSRFEKRRDDCQEPSARAAQTGVGLNLRAGLQSFSRSRATTGGERSATASSACNGVQGATATPACLAFPAMWFLQLTESKGGSRVRIPLSPPALNPLSINYLRDRMISLQNSVGCERRVRRSL